MLVTSYSIFLKNIPYILSFYHNSKSGRLELVYGKVKFGNWLFLGKSENWIFQTISASDLKGREADI